MACLIPILTLCAATANLLANPGFDVGLDGWKVGAMVEAATMEDRSAARISVQQDAAVSWHTIHQTVDASPYGLFQGKADAMGCSVTAGHGVYMALEFYDENGKRLSFAQSEPVFGDGLWGEINVRGVAPGKTAKARFCLIINGRGEAWFDNATMLKLDNLAPEPLEGEVTITVTDEIVCDSIIGFGAEDDGWFYNLENRKHGVTEEDIALREKRVRWMDSDWVRMFCWHKDWNPGGDWETFTFDSPNMQSHYRTLELYQELGAVVTLTGVEWGGVNTYGQPEKFAKAIGQLFEHLIKEKGFTCVQEWILTNEPNTHFLKQGYTFERFVELHALVKAEFARRGLNVRVVGSDDTAGLGWFAACVDNEKYFETADLFSSHRYFPYADRLMAEFFFDDRLDLLNKKTPRKPFVVAEFGFHDARAGTLLNPLMEEYDYAVWTSAFIINGLNKGVAGFCIWCLHEVYYPGDAFMNYGLWDFKDNDWRIRPVYHAISNFTRNTERGDKVRKCVSSHQRCFDAAMIGSTIFWVNKSDMEMPVKFPKSFSGEVRIYASKNVSQDSTEGHPARLTQHGFSAPPKSFGSINLKR